MRRQCGTARRGCRAARKNAGGGDRGRHDPGRAGVRADPHWGHRGGRVADLLVLDANPLDDIRHTLQIAAVYLRGVEMDRAAPRARVDGRDRGAAVSRFGDATYALTATKILGEVVPRRNEPLHTWEAFYWTPR